MLVGLEVSSAIPALRTGVGNYTLNLATHLARREASGRASFLYFSDRGESLFAPEADTSGQGTIYPWHRMPTRMLWMQAGLPRSIARANPDICHFPNHLAPLIGMRATPYVVTIHDMSVFRCPEYHAAKTVLTHRAILPIAARHARMIITVSESAREDILHYLKVPASRVRVIYEGVGAQFNDGARTAPSRRAAIRERYSLPEHYVLTVSTLQPRKNHARLMEAFDWLVRQEHIPQHLVVVGAHGWKDRGLRRWIARHGPGNRIHFLGYVADEDLPEIYRSADVFAFPSLYEGFGLPVLEAMACGVPCLISTDPALHEIAGTGNAVEAEPRSVADIAAGLYRLISSPRQCAQLRTRGLARAASFSWQRCADDTYRLYDEVLEHSGSPVGLRQASSYQRHPWLPDGGDMVTPLSS